MIAAALTGLSAAPSRAETIRITVDKLAFSPAQISARVGDTIEWTNTDFVTHTATARTLDWDVTPAGQDVSSGNQKGRVGRLLLPVSPEHDGAHRRPVKLRASLNSGQLGERAGAPPIAS